jgi:hypothetical protein
VAFEFNGPLDVVSHGMSNLEVLRAATLNGAEAMGHAQDLGSIEVGKLADLVVLEKDSLQDIRNTIGIRFVMKNGELFDGNTLNDVWPRQKIAGPYWWWSNEPKYSGSGAMARSRRLQWPWRVEGQR